MRDELLLDDLLIDWCDLFEQSREYCVCGDNENDEWSVPFDIDAFVKCMKGTYRYFFADQERLQTLTPKEIEVYGFVFAYSQLRLSAFSDNEDKFNASTLVAEEMANTIRDPNYAGLKGTKLMWFVLNEDGNLQKYEYDIETGDLSDFIKYAMHG